VLGDPAVLDAEDVDLLDGDAASGGRPAQELAGLGAAVQRNATRSPSPKASSRS
jgi:hypothetical protein